ncbi:hypothetical protein [Streptomyces lushanensis]|uniref:hypothetical protein n=1 Tax=Streptomyces lushanensis TaxID=1434255 RepID=UPI00099F666C|nr:hypothetical protein [Streptomyces lushanensis]
MAGFVRQGEGQGGQSLGQGEWQGAQGQRQSGQGGQGQDGRPRRGERLIDLAGGPGVPAPRTGGAGPGGELRHSGGPWTRAAGAAEALRTHMGLVRGEFAAAHEGVAAGAEGLGAAAVLPTVRMSWERRIEIAMEECASLAVHLRAVAREQGENEAALRASFARAGGGAR